MREIKVKDIQDLKKYKPHRGEWPVREAEDYDQDCYVKLDDVKRMFNGLKEIKK